MILPDIALTQAGIDEAKRIISEDGECAICGASIWPCGDDYEGKPMWSHYGHEDDDGPDHAAIPQEQA